MKTLVTGATGLIGSAIVRMLVARGEDVRILRREQSPLGLLGENTERVEHVVGDVTDHFTLEEAVEGVDHVYHVAALIGTKRDFDRMLRINVGGTAAIVDAALESGVRRLVHTSSIAALGRSEHPSGVIDETAVWQESRANSAYAVSKHLSDLEVYRGIAEGLDAVMVNPSLVFGVGRAGQNTRLVIDRIRSRAIPGIPVGGNNVVDVLDVADGHLRAMERGRTGERYILGSENLMWKEIMETIADVFGVAPPRFRLHPSIATTVAAIVETLAFVFRFRPLITFENVRQAARVYRYSNEKAVRELGCTFRPFRETVERIAAALGV